MIDRVEAETVLRFLLDRERIEAVLLAPTGAVRPQVDIRTQILSTGLLPGAGILFDHWQVPRAARRLGADLILSLHLGAPLRASSPTVALGWTSAARGESRLERSLHRATQRGMKAILFPNDVPAPHPEPEWVSVPPLLPAALSAERPRRPAKTRSLGLPESYVLGLEEDRQGLARILAAWTWAQESVGGLTPLVLGATSDESRRRMDDAVARSGNLDYVHVVRIRRSDLFEILASAACLLHGGEIANLPVLRWAMAAGVPVAAAGTPMASSVLGSAGFLADPSDTRGLGAACIALLVDERLVDELREKGFTRVASARMEAPAAWVEVFDRLLGREVG